MRDFLSWWRASKYCQVVIPQYGWQQIAEDSYAAGYAAAQSGSPREPTRAMLDAGLAYYEGRTGARMVTIGGIWDAMYDAWAQEQTGGKAAPINKPSQPDHAGTAGPPDHQPAATTLAGRPDAGAAQAETDGPAADPLPVAWATPSLLVTMSAVEKRLLTSPEMRGRGAGWEADARDADRYSVPLYRAAALDRLRAERDDWKRLAENWTACADAAQQPPEFYEKYNEGTMRAMQALLTRERTEGAALRTERDALRECVRAADAMALECRRVGLISSTWLEDYDDARAKVKVTL